MKEQTVDYLLRTTWQAVARMYNEEAQKYGATMATGFVLLSLDKEKGTPSTLLGPKMGMEASSLTRTLKSMETRGLIERKKNPTDGRGVLIYLTEEGKAKRDLSTATVKRFNEKLQSKITKSQWQHFTAVIATLTQLIVDREIFDESCKEE